MPPQDIIENLSGAYHPLEHNVERALVVQLGNAARLQEQIGQCYRLNASVIEVCRMANTGIVC